MLDLEEMLERLAFTFTVRDIMVHRENLVTASDEPSAQEALRNNPEFDTIPIERKGVVSAYVKRGSKRMKGIGLREVIGDATSILDLVGVLSDREHCFVLGKNGVEGFVHFSDLNRSIVKLPFFVLFQALERHCVDRMPLPVTKKNLLKIMDEQAVDRYVKKLNKQSKKRVDLGLVNVIGFADTMRLACHFKIVDLSERQIDVLVGVRNRVFHANRPLIDSWRDVKRLSKTREICTPILEM